jgi:hypothetical protein
VAAVFVFASSSLASVATSGSPPDSISWPVGTVVLPFEDLEGAILVSATVTQEKRDTTGTFVLDTGAGYLGLDHGLALELGIGSEGGSSELALSRIPLSRIQMGDLSIDQAQVMTFDADVVRTVLDRPIIGLIGHELFRDRALWIDYSSKRVALIPSRGEEGTAAPVSPIPLSAAAVALPFRLSHGGKVLVRARVSPRNGRATGWLTFAFDTGSTKCALLVHAKDDVTAGWRPALQGLESPTLMGRAVSSMVRAARFEAVGISDGASPVALPDVDVLVVHGPLGGELSRVAGEKISGLLGYSFLRRFRVLCDYPRRVLWLDPDPHFREDRPYEHSHAGLQLERRAGLVRVMSVAKPSPADRAGIRPGDHLVAIDRVSTSNGSLPDLGRLMEGKPGSIVSLTIRRGGHDTTYRLRRRLLL